MKLIRPSWRALLAPLLFASACAKPVPPAEPAVVDEWQAATDALLSGVEPRAQPRARALTALAMYEAFVAADTTPFRSLAGQVNGLWRVPLPVTGPLDAAIAAAEAQRVVLDSLLATDSLARRVVDSLASAHVAARRAAGVREEVALQSLAHGAAIGKTLLALAARNVRGTLVLRHPQECVYRTGVRGPAPVPQDAVVQAGEAPVAPLLAAIEARVMATLTSADSAVALARDAAAGECVRDVVRGRLRTRAAGR